MDTRCRLCGQIGGHRADCDYVNARIVEWTIKVLLGAVELIRDPANWVRGGYTVDALGKTVRGDDALDANGNGVPFWDMRAKRFSADRAISRAAMDLDAKQWAQLSEWASRRVHDVAMSLYRTPFWHVNDGTTHQAVLNVLATTIADLRANRESIAAGKGAA